MIARSSNSNTYRADNARLAARVAELELNPVVSTAFVDELRPLKSLLTTESEYEAARRAYRAGLLRAERRGGHWFASARTITEWRRITGRAPLCGHVR